MTVTAIKNSKYGTTTLFSKNDVNMIIDRGGAYEVISDNEGLILYKNDDITIEIK